jgi:hypothetical protein
VDDHQFVVRTFQRLEAQLLSIGAQGRGLGDYIKSVEHKLPLCLVKHLASLNGIRNKFIHKGVPIDRTTFEERCAEAERELEKVAAFLSSHFYFYIINKMSGKALDLDSSSADDGARIHLWSLARTPNQAWLVRRLDNGLIAIISKSSGKCAVVRGGFHEDGAGLQQWSYFGLEHQQWRLAEQDDGSYQISPRHSGKCLDASYDEVYADGCPVVQWPWWGGDNQRWWLKAAVDIV